MPREEREPPRDPQVIQHNKPPIDTDRVLKGILIGLLVVEDDESNSCGPG